MLLLPLLLMDNSHYSHHKTTGGPHVVNEHIGHFKKDDQCCDPSGKDSLLLCRFCDILRLMNLYEFNHFPSFPKSANIKAIHLQPVDTNFFESTLFEPIKQHPTKLQEESHWELILHY